MHNLLPCYSVLLNSFTSNILILFFQVWFKNRRAKCRQQSQNGSNKNRTSKKQAKSPPTQQSAAPCSSPSTSQSHASPSSGESGSSPSTTLTSLPPRSGDYSPSTPDSLLMPSTSSCMQKVDTSSTYQFNCPSVYNTNGYLQNNPYQFHYDNYYHHTYQAHPMPPSHHQVVSPSAGQPTGQYLGTSRDMAGYSTYPPLARTECLDVPDSKSPSIKFEAL